MTNEEAIKILFNIRAYYASLTAGYPPHDCYGLGDMKCSDMCDALLKGIRLLKQEPCEDCVSRQAVKDILDARGAKAIMTFEHFKELLDKLPSVTLQQKTGYWERETFDLGNDLPIRVAYQCSECGEYFDGEFKYCPNCGAKMESEE